MTVGRLWQLVRYIGIPVMLGLCFLCALLGVVAMALTPSGLNPAEAIVLRGYLIRNDTTLNTPKSSTAAALQPFEIESTDTATSIGIKLVTQGFIDNGTLFSRYMQYEGLDTQLREGTFYISPAMTIPQMATELTNPLPITVRIVVIEGWRMEQIAEAIDAQPLLNFTGNDFLALVQTGTPLPTDFQQRHGIPSGASLEGFLFPATYDVAVGGSAFEFRDQLLAAFDANYSTAMQRDATGQGYTTFEIVTLASIVEREAVIPAERPNIASVYLNRLNIGQLLQADPTTQYGIGNTRDGSWWPVLTLQDYQLNHPYNTYVVDGLPPGPIANAGVSSMRAVIYPAETPYFFFRAACDGSGLHQFSVTYEEHLSKGC